MFPTLSSLECYQSERPTLHEGLACISAQQQDKSCRQNMCVELQALLAAPWATCPSLLSPEASGSLLEDMPASW